MRRRLHGTHSDDDLHHHSAALHIHKHALDSPIHQSFPFLQPLPFSSPSYPPSHHPMHVPAVPAACCILNDDAALAIATGRLVAAEAMCKEGARKACASGANKQRLPRSRSTRAFIVVVVVMVLVLELVGWMEGCGDGGSLAWLVVFWPCRVSIATRAHLSAWPAALWL